MFRPASRLIARAPALRTQLSRVAPPTRRYLSTAPPTQKSRSWKSLVARVGIAGTFIYYYNTTDVFAEEPRHELRTLPDTVQETEDLQTIEALAQERQKRKAAEAQSSSTPSPAADTAAAAGAEGGIGGLEEEADQQGAFNPETGEINWDCPCLGGMANGPCGEDFKAAFSCFVFSQEEPKGMDCIDKFKDMQNCFRQYPEIYGSELEPEDEDDVTSDPQQQPLPAADTSAQPAETVGAAIPQESAQPGSDSEGLAQRAKAAAEQVKQEYGEPIKDNVKAIIVGERSKTMKEPTETDDVVPKAWHDERAANVKAEKN